jgi:hypothetical protein
MLFRAVKVLDKTVDVKVNSDAALSRESKATSDGEFARVGTFGVRVVFESRGNIR